MKTEVDFAGVFRAALPKVYISSIELLPTNIAGAKDGVSYDEESDDRLEVNQYGKQRPVKGRQRFDEATGLAMGLRVKAELTIRDFVRKNKRTIWFQDPDLNKYLKINVILAKDRKVIEDLQEGQFTPRYIKKLIRRKKIVQKIISVKKDNQSIVDQKKQVIDGKDVFCVTYEVSFDVTTYNPRNLALFASTFINLKEYQLQKLPQLNSEREVLQGIVASQNIINRGDVPARSKVALLPDGKVWAGPVHFHPGKGLMVGAFHTSRPHESLEEKDVPNLVVKDYRSLDKIKEADLLLRPYRKRRRKKLENKRAQGNRIIKKEVYVTEPDYSFNELNEMRFLFHLDYHKTIAQRTQFGACFVNADPRSKEFILNNTKIKDIVITRHRVLRGLTRSENIPTDFEDRDEIVAESGDGKRRRLRPRRKVRSKNPELEDTEKINIGGIREVNLGLRNSEGIRTFTVSDFEMARKTDGKYTYSVSMTLEDGTVAFVEEQKKKLSQAIRSLEDYYRVASQRLNTDHQTGGFTKSFVDTMLMTYPVPNLGQVNRMRPRRRRKIVQSSIARAPWLNAISAYADVAASLTSVDTADLARGVLLMEGLASPTSGTTQGLELILGMMRNLRNKISSVVGGTPGEPKADEVNYKQKTSSFKGKMPKATVRINKRFKEVHDSNKQNFVGYDFLNLRRRQNVGLRVVSTDQMRTRLLQENQKYFNQDPMEDQEQPKIDKTESLGAKDFTRYINLQDAFYSYLTPARVFYGDRRLKLVNRGRRLWSPRQYNVILSSLMATTTPRDSLSDLSIRPAPAPLEPAEITVQPPVTFDSNYSPTVAKIDKDDLSIAVANSVFTSTLGASFVSPAVHSLSVSQESFILGSENNDAEDSVFGADPKDFLGENSKFATDRLEPIELDIDDSYEDTESQQEDYSSVSNIFAASVLNPRPVDKSKSSSVSLLDPTNERNIIDKRLEQLDKTEEPNREKQEFMSQLPNQVKSIFLSADQRVNKDWFEILRTEEKDLLKTTNLTGLMYYNYSHINQIQVLEGFGEDKLGNPDITDPIYSRLTKDSFDRISRSGRAFICRMRGYKFKMFKKNKKLKLPEYNQNFLLISRNARPAPEEDGVDAAEEEFELDALEIAEDEQDESSIFVERLAEYSDLNTTGRKMLRMLIRRNTLLDGLMPDFTSTVYVQQPKTITRAGTTFASERENQPTTQGSQATRQSAPIRRSRISRSSTRRSTASPMMTTTRTTGGGTTGGGGGY